MNKTTLLTAAAVFALVGPLAVSASAQGRQNPAQYENERRGAQESRSDDRRDVRSDDNRGGRDRREDWRDDRRDARWDDARHNGYYDNNRWYYGPPPSDRYQRAGFTLGYRPWTIGQSLGYYQTRFQTVDYRSQNLRRPARGTHWVRDDRGDYLLVDRRGRITQVVVSGNRPGDRSQSWRDNRADARWDEARHNGYYSDNRWYFGPPPSGMSRPVTYGYQPWRRGERLGYYNGRYAEVDYRSQQGLSAPPRGHHWVRSDSGDLLLAAIATGVIVQVILNSSR